jgi:copper chaperone
MKTTLYVGGMTCGHCKAAIGDALEKLEGVNDFAIDLASKLIEVDFDNTKLTLSGIIVAINEQGYEVEIA